MKSNEETKGKKKKHRTEIIIVRTTPYEKQTVQKKARALDKTVTDFILDEILDNRKIKKE